MERRGTDDLTREIGVQLHRLRIDADLTQAQLAERSNLGVSTIVGLERGAGTLSSFVRVLRALHSEDWLETLAPVDESSPLEQLRASRTSVAPRRRVRQRRSVEGRDR